VAKLLNEKQSDEAGSDDKGRVVYVFKPKMDTQNESDEEQDADATSFSVKSQASQRGDRDVWTGSAARKREKDAVGESGACSKARSDLPSSTAPGCARTGTLSRTDRSRRSGIRQALYA